MKKTDQLIKELQMLINNTELNEIIEEKMMDMWRDANSNATNTYILYQKDFNYRQRSGLTSEEIERMGKSHLWQDDEYGTCIITNKDYNECSVDESTFSDCPQYCFPKE